MKKCCVKICANDKKVDFSKVQKQMVTVKELSLDSFKHVPLETWALEPENTYKGENDKVHPWTCQTCTKKKAQGNVLLRLRRRGCWSWCQRCSIHLLLSMTWVSLLVGVVVASDMILVYCRPEFMQAILNSFKVNWVLDASISDSIKMFLKLGCR